MARFIFEDLTPEQAKVFADWYLGQGEQNADIWFEEQKQKTPYPDLKRPGGYPTILENGDVIVHCR